MSAYVHLGELGYWGIESVVGHEEGIKWALGLDGVGDDAEAGQTRPLVS